MFIRPTALLTIIATLIAASAHAGTFSIAPVRVELSQSKHTEVLTLRNQENTPVVIQASVHSWSQRDGEDQLGDTRDLLSTPPVFTLAAGGEQVIRVALRTPLDGRQEGTYRLILQEVPPDAPAGFTGLRVALKISLPIFVAPVAAVKPVVLWQARRTDDEHIEISAQNDGDAHLQITDFTVTSPSGNSVKQAISRYVLPGSRIAWLLPAASLEAGAKPLKLHAFTDQGEISTELTLADH